MKFTAHNILLNNGERTMSDSQVLISESAMWTSVKKSIGLFLPEASGNITSLRAADLGCLEGGFSVELARMGFDTTGIEAREENLRKCYHVKRNLDLPRLRFIQGDVRDLPDHGQFDVVFCYGLLYHLNDPVQFLKTLGKCTTRLLFLNTHFAPDRDVRYQLGPVNRYLIAPFQKRTGFLEFQKNFRLSSLQESEGYTGRWYREWNRAAGRDKVEKLLWASYNNNRSFWLRKKDLTMALHDSGFHHVFEQFDFTGDIAPTAYTSMYNRTMFVAVKQPRSGFAPGAGLLGRR